MLSKQDKDGRVTIVIPRDQTVTGHGSDGKHTTFHTRDGRSYRTRNISEQESGWFMAVTGTIILMCAYFSFAFSNGDPKLVSEAVFPLGFAAFIVMAIGLLNGGFALKEVLMLASAAQLCARPISLQDEEALLALTFIVALLVWYAAWWVRQAVWEPFVSAILFFGWLLMCRFGLAPQSVAGPVFAVFGIMAFFWTCGIAWSADTYRTGWSRMSD